MGMVWVKRWRRFVESEDPEQAPPGPIDSKVQVVLADVSSLIITGADGQRWPPSDKLDAV